MSDQSQRQRALSITQSFIVEAPAGSGKTSLLIQRYLALLAQVQKPEEILALTFTRKAASEMRTRIIQALEDAQKNPPLDSHKLHIWNLASQAFKHNQQLNWNLLTNPNRLRISTIDSLCTNFVSQLPILSKLNKIRILSAEETEKCCQSATRALFEDFLTKTSLENILLHLDNDWQKAENLLINMLIRRDQWLPYIMRHSDLNEQRHILEAGLANIVKENLVNCKASFPSDLFFELLDLLDFSQQNYFQLTELEQWKVIANLLLTQKFEWRKMVDARNGFPAKENANNADERKRFIEQKARMHNLLAQLQDQHDLREHLHAIALSPQIKYDDTKWTVLLNFIEHLKILAAYYLPQEFHKCGGVDYIEIALAADRALGTDEAPTDLALYLDAKIQHILVDEFQDTSITQFRLLEKLTYGWQSNDGKTLFLVGDPMQSIYKFRDAQVGLFLRAKKYGINGIALENLTLSSNFRSTQYLVNWTNKTFVDIFPKIENIGYGAVKFIASQAKSTENKPNVHLYAFQNGDGVGEANQVVNIIQETLKQNPQGSIAILVRNRSHLLEILPTLQNTNLPYDAVEVKTLEQNIVISDLFALTKSLLRIEDRIAWLAILRAPWCGLTLNDLHIIANAEPRKPIWYAVDNFYNWPKLSEDAKIRLDKVVQVFRNSFAQKRRCDLREWVENTWIALGGKACISTTDLVNVATYFRLLASLDRAGDIEDFVLLEQKLATLYTESSSSTDHKLQIMTIHKAKGLEFDTVILPGLNYASHPPEPSLLLWAERPNAFGQESGDLILAPIKSSYEKEDSIYSYLNFEDKQRHYHELSRLLYVAVTRAKNALHLLTCFSKDNTKPTPNSLLEQFWPVFATVKINETYANNDADNAITMNMDLANYYSRLPSNTFPQLELLQTESLPNVINDWHMTLPNKVAQDIGTVIHETLAELSHIEIDKWLNERFPKARIKWRTRLLQFGIDQNLEQALDKIELAINNTLADPKGRWILDYRHTDAHSEFKVSINNHHTIKNFIIDRTFIDNGIRWIIDFKTSQEKQPELYRKQLKQYADIMRIFDKDKYPIKLGLYFPMVMEWEELL